MLRQEQKSIVLMQDIPRKYSRLCALVFASYLGLGARAKACVSDNKNPKFVSCGKDSGCIWDMKPSLIYIFAFQDLNPDADIIEEESVNSAARTSLKHWRQRSGTKVQVKWRLDKGLRRMQFFPDHITN